MAFDRTRIFPRWVVALAIIALVGLVIWALRGVLTPVFFAFLIAYMLDPVVDRFERRRIPRAVGITILLTAVLGAFAVFFVLAIPAIGRDLSSFATELPSALKGLLDRAEPMLADMGIPVPHSFDEAVAQMGMDTGQLASKAAQPASKVLEWLWGGTGTVLGMLATAVIVPVLAFYLLHDFDRLTAQVRDLIPPHWRPFVLDVVGEVDWMLGQFVRGQLTVMVILALLYCIAYSIIGVRLAIVIGVVAGMLSFIPYVGGATALGLAILMSLIDWHGPMQLVWVGIAYGVIQVLEGFVITPRVLGDKVGLSPLWVLLALMIGGELFGFLGVMLALPGAAVAKIFAMRGLSWYRKSEFFRTARPPEGLPDGLVALLKEEGLPDDLELAARKDAALDDVATTRPDRGGEPAP
ncbi:MAG TPA: AI-2E family transporter [Nannocystaceae bacterium]|nr:AI-2E family transporter [Nannocystaceae bacterium]